jgi:hypothetical protein
VAGGIFDCCASAPVTDATAIKLATAETFFPELFSNVSLTAFIAAMDRSDRGAFAWPIFYLPQFFSRMRIVASAYEASYRADNFPSTRSGR